MNVTEIFVIVDAISFLMLLFLYWLNMAAMARKAQKYTENIQQKNVFE